MKKTYKKFSKLDLDKKYLESLEVSIDNRKLEIELLWKRTTVFWGFIVALYIGVATIKNSSMQLASILSNIGMVFSLIWTLSNRGSRSWQESWEIKAAYLFKKLYFSKSDIDIYQRVVDDKKNKETFFILRHRKYSLSRLLISLSDFTVIFWIGLSGYFFIDLLQEIKFNSVKDYSGVIFFLFSVFYCVYIVFATKSKSIGITKEEFFNSIL